MFEVYHLGNWEELILNKQVHPLNDIILNKCHMESMSGRHSQMKSIRYGHGSFLWSNQR